LQFNTHLTYYSHNNKKGLETNLGRALIGQLIKKGYMLRIIIEPIGNKKILTDRIDKEGSYLYSFRKSADFLFGREIGKSNLCI
jgi:hypothetical protein